MAVSETTQAPLLRGSDKRPKKKTKPHIKGKAAKQSESDERADPWYDQFRAELQESDVPDVRYCLSALQLAHLVDAIEEDDKDRSVAILREGAATASELASVIDLAEALDGALVVSSEENVRLRERLEDHGPGIEGCGPRPLTSALTLGTTQGGLLERMGIDRDEL